MKPDIIVPDTSVIIDGRITEIIKKSKEKLTVIVPQAVVSELEYQANQGKGSGFDGLKELRALRELEKKEDIKIEFSGEKPDIGDIENAELGRVDELIREVAEKNNATLVTSDRVQAIVSEVKGLSVRYIKPDELRPEPIVFKLFDDKTMSLHLKENVPVYAKKGSVGHFELVKIKEKVIKEELENYIKEIEEFAYSDSGSYIESEYKGATIIQLREYRIVITRHPFSDALELTIVKPLVKTKLDDYDISEKLMNRLESKAEGIFVSGSPGAGKTTFVQALAEFYQSKRKVVKTMEYPRDLQVVDEITQYSPLEGSLEKTADVLLLVRPDYTIFDELKKTYDFKIFADMRLAGVGMVGVTHASKAIDAIQRLVSRVELGMIPHIVDTVIFIEAGKIKQVYELRMVVKVPHGMTESDLSRPVIEIRDFETMTPEYEMYTYGEEIVAIPISKGRRTDISASVEITRTKKHIVLYSKEFRGRVVRIMAENEHIGSGRVNRAGNLKINQNTAAGRTLLNAVNSGRRITLQR